jgi:hypothetical protein
MKKKIEKNTKLFTYKFSFQRKVQDQKHLLCGMLPDTSFGVLASCIE